MAALLLISPAMEQQPPHQGNLMTCNQQSFKDKKNNNMEST
jgi:hypothetical protein